MNQEFIIYLARQGLEMSLLVSLPVLAVTIIVGIIVGMLQAVTSVRDQTIGMVVKLLCVGATLLLAGHWMLQLSMEFTAKVFNQMQALGH
jgi:flagellar biosynthesis protein FliQ